MPAGRDQSLWAVNGHMFQVRAADGDRVLAHLAENPGIDVSGLDEAALALTRTLYSVRGVDDVPRGGTVMASPEPLVTADTLDWAEFADRFWDRQHVLYRAVHLPPFAGRRGV